MSEVLDSLGYKLPPNPEFTEGPLTLDEQIKILSLFENPPEAAQVRRALRFYQVPDNLEYNYGTNEEAARVMYHFDCPQNPHELAWMVDIVQRIGARSFLEVGSNFGGTLKRVAAVLPKGSKIVSVDLPCDDTPKCLNPLATLKETCRKLGMLGANVELFVGDSHSPRVIEAVRQQGPFDFGFIDGDHTYEGVRADWENYGPMCRVIGFHDIAAGVEPVVRFWEELKAEGRYRTEECVSYDSKRYFGIGIVFREE